MTAFRYIHPRSQSWARAFLLALLCFASSHAARSQTPAPVVRSFLYVDAYQTRFEMILPLQAAMEWVKSPISPDESLTPSAQQALVAKIAPASDEWIKLTLNNSPQMPQDASVTLVQSSTAAAVPFPLPDDKPTPAKEVHVTISWQVPTLLPLDSVEVTLFQAVPGSPSFTTNVFFDDQSEDVQCSQPHMTIRWANKGRLALPQRASPVPGVPVQETWRVSIALSIWVFFGLSLMIWMKVKRLKWPGGIVPFLAAWTLGGVVMSNMFITDIRSPFSEKVTVTSKDEAQAILDPVLQNIYRALQYARADDRKSNLARSVAADQVSTVHDLLLGHLAVANHKDLFTRVGSESVSWDIDSFSPTENGFSADITWTALGTISHLGHPDTRVNRYKAALQIGVSDGEWKVTDLKVRDHRQM